MASGDAIQLLRRVPLFESLSDKELRQVAASMKERTFPAGREIAREGDQGVGFFVIADGEASVSVGGKPVGRLSSGDYFGEIALITDSDRTATVVADTDVRAYGMTSWDFRPLVEENAAIAWGLLQAIAKKVRVAERRNE